MGEMSNGDHDTAAEGLGGAREADAPGGFFAMAGDSLRAMFRRPFAVGEFLEQTWFIASVSFLPAIFVTIPFTVVVQFFINQLLQEIGATDPQIGCCHVRQLRALRCRRSSHVEVGRVAHGCKGRIHRCTGSLRAAGHEMGVGAQGESGVAVPR
ncbi:hypothetical protein [Nocardioides immobilis]|uniref:hypothetical protein n=1 Tax=Nocardioides immobilis TaxID=2049295 RepID=UPI0015FC75EF|nr:hypothetical protein [Nocardioides immobilis]